MAITLVINNLNANPVSQATAEKVCQTFTQTAFDNVSRSDEMHLVKATDTYYVFNIGESGFVIVSADDCFRPIVGYSNEGVFPTENPSPEMIYYLDNLSQGRDAALRASIQQSAEVGGEWQRLLQGEQLPSRNGNRKSFFLVKTRWNQDYPYNKLCPIDPNGGRCYAGCVATAMSQVMNYWKYPTQGFGSHSYTSSYGQLTADFSTAFYDFDNMPLAVTNMSPDEESDEIALFMYHCGVSVDMMYSPSGSGAYSEDVPEVVLKHFGYTNRCRLIYRDACSLEEFQALLRNQFDLGWPVYYSGTDTGGNGGHAFVCDGYDDNDMFHFNWGWSGSGDGFFAIDALDVSSYAFNSGQAFIANYVPASVFLSTTKSPDLFEAVPNGDDDFTVTLSWTNPSATLDGTPVETLDQIVVMRDGVTIQTFDNPMPGEAMTFIDEAGLPVTVNYTVHAVYNGLNGRKAHADGINLGPACNWTVKLLSNQETGWGDGLLTLMNSSGVKLAELTASRGEDSFEVEVPQGRVTFTWTAPTDSLGIGLMVYDALGQTVFTYEGPSTLMPTGLFFETVNTCGGESGTETPSELKAEVVDDDVVLQWKGVTDPGYGYIIYRDGYFYTMVGDVVNYTDEDAALEMHSYFVTAFFKEGESDPSNTVSAVKDTEKEAPSNLDFEYLENGKIKLTWTAPEQTENLAGYQIYRKAMDGEYKRIKNVGAGSNEFSDSFKVPDGNKYYYKVLADYEERGYVQSAPARSLKHPDQHYVEVNRTHIPSGLTLTEQQDGLLLQWEWAMLAETYNVYRNGELIAEGLTELQYEGVADGEPAYYQVTGVLNGVESNRSNKACYAHYDVEETDMMGVTLYPNPSIGQTVVQAEGMKEIKVYTVTGQLILVIETVGDKATVDLSGQSPGVYFLNVRTDCGEQVLKVVLMQSF